MFVYDFGKRAEPPCLDCDERGHCTMNCSPRTAVAELSMVMCRCPNRECTGWRIPFKGHCNRQGNLITPFKPLTFEEAVLFDKLAVAGIVPPVHVHKASVAVAELVYVRNLKGGFDPQLRPIPYIAASIEADEKRYNRIATRYPLTEAERDLTIAELMVFYPPPVDVELRGGEAGHTPMRAELHDDAPLNSAPEQTPGHA